MTKKDYIKFADMIADNINRYSDDPSKKRVIERMSIDIQDIFSFDAPSFDHERFDTYIKDRTK